MAEDERKGADSSSSIAATLEPAQVLVLHYHYFKNAGTSVDEMLKRNFGSRWGQREFDTPAGRPNVKNVEAHLRTVPNLLAFSSHTANLPTPVLEGRLIFPIVFVRHPIDRLKSAYLFEKVQEADTFGARLAKANDFAGYVRELIKHSGNRQARNFQVQRLSINEPESQGLEIDRAIRAVKSLPFVGLVEQYDRSLQRLQEKLMPLVPTFQAISVQKNVTRKPEPLEHKLVEIEKEIGSALFADACEANADDIALHQLISNSYEKSSL